MGVVSMYVGRGEWRCTQSASGRHKENRRLGKRRNRREEIKRK